MNTIELLSLLDKNKEISIDELLDKIPDLNFVDYFETLKIMKNMTKSEIIEKSSLDRNYAYQILNGTKIPSQDKVIMLALAMNLNLHDTNCLLILSHNKILYPKIRRDAIIIFCINRNYSVMKTNELLHEYNFQILS